MEFGNFLSANIPFLSYLKVPRIQTAAFLAPYFLDWLAHPDYDDYWKRWNIEDHYSEIAVPSLTVAAWYDIFLGGSLNNYVGMKQHAESEAARQGQRLLVTIGGHAGSGRKIGQVDFGATAEFNEDDRLVRLPLQERRQ
jgi:predicted acyl esterase